MTGLALRSRPPQNAHLALKFEDEETLPSNILREMGFKLVEREGAPAWRSYDDASRAIVELVNRNGFNIDPQTLEIQKEKNAWDGAFGAYYEPPRGNRLAFTVNVDHRKRHPTLSPRQYTAGLGSGQAAMPARISAAVEYRGVLFVTIAGTRVYKMENWSGSGEGTAYFTLVFTHSNGSCVFRDLVVHDDVLYAAAGETAVYAYSADGGTTWVESNRAGSLANAEQFMVLNDLLHKTRMPNLHYQTTSGINGGAAWSSADAIGETGDSSTGSFEMVGLSNNTVFNKEEGIFNLDGDGNTTDLLPGLQKKRDRGNGWHAYVWSGDKLLYPTNYGLLYMIQGGRFYHVAPALSQERALEVGSVGRFIGRVRAMVDDTQYLYAEIQKPADNTHRIVCLEQVGDELVWRSLLDLSTTTSDEMWITSQSTSGPILWASSATDLGFRAAYWTLPAGPDPLQDTRMRYASSGSLYEPWLDLGCPNTPKLWFEVTITGAANGSGGSITMVLEADDGTTYSRTLSVTSTPTPQSILIPKQFIQRRVRFRWDFATTTAATTPILINYTVRAQPNPEPIRIFEFTVDATATGGAFGYTQRQIRNFLDHVRKAVYPLHLYTIMHPNIVSNTGAEDLEEVWSVMPFPPPPMEQAIRHDSTGNGRRWDTAWTLTLIERKTRQFELLEEGEDDLPPSEDLGGPVSIELITLWVKSNTLYPAWTTDRTAGTVRWSFNNTGLPTTAHGYLVLDPWDVQNKAAIILTRQTTNDVEVWYNSAYRTAGNAWVKKFGVTQFNTATSLAATLLTEPVSVWNQHGLFANISTEQHWGFMVNSNASTMTYFIRTNDNFATFAAVALDEAADPGNFTMTGFHLGQWDNQFAISHFYNTINGTTAIVYSTDNAATAGGPLPYQMGGPFSLGASIMLPYQGNQSYNELFLFEGEAGGDFQVWRTTTRGASEAAWATWSSVVNFNANSPHLSHSIRLDPVGGQRAIIAREASAGGSNVLQRSNDRMLTWETNPVVPPGTGGIVDAALWPGGGLETALIQHGVGAATNIVLYTEDHVTFTDLTGAFATDVVAVDASLVALTISFGIKAPT
jgi:hypothetical protein